MRAERIAIAASRPGGRRRGRKCMPL